MNCLFSQAQNFHRFIHVQRGLEATGDDKVSECRRESEKDRCPRMKKEATIIKIIIIAPLEWSSKAPSSEFCWFTAFARNFYDPSRSLIEHFHASSIPSNGYDDDKANYEIKLNWSEGRVDISV